MDDFDEDEDAILIRMTHDSAKKFARLLRMVGTDACVDHLTDPFDNLATSLGSHMGITSNSDDNDELDEGLDDGDVIEWQIYDSHSLNDHVTPTEERVVYREQNDA